jgi:hypothetical protein
VLSRSDPESSVTVRHRHARRKHKPLQLPPQSGFAEQVDWPRPAETGVAGQDEIHAHPELFDSERLHHLPDAEQQAIVGELEGRTDLVTVYVAIHAL